MNNTALQTIGSNELLQASGGDGESGGFGQDMLNLGKATVNGATNALNFFHDHPVELGKFGTFKIAGERLQKPFTNDPLSKVGKRTVPGTPHPAPKRR